MEPRFLKMIDATGKENVEELGGPGGTIRMAIGEQGRRSSTWRVWANPATADVYVAARPVAGVQKFSLHQSGDWRHQWVSEDLAVTHGGGANRILDKWVRPETPNHGITPGLSIWVPHGHLDEIAGDKDTASDVIYLPDAPEGNFAGIHIAIWTPDLMTAELTDSIPVAGFTLASGDAVVAFYSQRPINENDLEAIGGSLTELEAAHVARGTTIAEQAGKVPALRAALSGHEEDGRRYVYDLSASQVRIVAMDATSPDG